MQEAALVNIKYAPIYDSGSSLGREIPDEKIIKYTNNPDEIKKYIRNGKSEVKWNNEKINHFELLSKIKISYNSHLLNTINMVLSKYNRNAIKTIIDNIDNGLSDEFQESKLSLQRKELIFKFIDQRIETLKELLN